MIPPHNIYQIYHSFSVRDDCSPPKCGELSEYTDSAHTEVEDPFIFFIIIFFLNVYCPQTIGSG